MAIPARDEASRIETCLTALSRQSQPPDAVVLLLNNCTDATAHIAHRLARTLNLPLRTVCIHLPPEQANAGHARRIAMAIAAEQAGLDGILLTTDADAVVPPDWIRRCVSGLLRGADLVCGRAVIDPVESAMIPPGLQADDRLECRLIGLLSQLEWILDPDPNDPPPRHTEASGASLAVRAAAFDSVMGIPAIASGEDRAFVAALRRIDARIRHDPAIEVVVSGRVQGRAVGGMAETIRRRMVRQDEFTDAQIEPALDAFRRFSLRRRVRSAWTDRTPDRFLADDLALPPAQLANLLAAPFFGQAWANIETHSRILHRQGVRFIDLPAQIEAATDLLSALAAPQAAAAE